jgi:competence protein ComEC
LASAGVGRRALAEGARLSWEGASLSVLSPRAPSSPPLRVRNEDSLVLEVSFGDVRLLLTGDLGGEAERTLAVRSADVLKVPHHGSASSSSPAFVSDVRPRLAIVSCGASGAFGSARPEVLGRYAGAGALVLRTDRDGTIDVATDGSRLWVSTARDRQERRIR